MDPVAYRAFDNVEDSGILLTYILSKARKRRRSPLGVGNGLKLCLWD